MMFSMATGGTSTVFQIKFGYHIAKVYAVMPPG
ncbi:MAG: hypothetical protein KAJ19_27170 [Gammaproteobacteria bacterium]|nr:hypothetical protein [Gammaproteobacteria bacterium]